RHDFGGADPTFLRHEKSRCPLDRVGYFEHLSGGRRVVEWDDPHRRRPSRAAEESPRALRLEDLANLFVRFVDERECSGWKHAAGRAEVFPVDTSSRGHVLERANDVGATSEFHRAEDELIVVAGNVDDGALEEVVRPEVFRAVAADVDGGAR